MSVQFFKKIAIFAIFFCFANEVVLTMPSSSAQPSVAPSALPPAVVPTATGTPAAVSPPRVPNTGVGSPAQPNPNITPATALSPHPRTPVGGFVSRRINFSGPTPAPLTVISLPALAVDALRVITDLQSLYFDETSTVLPSVEIDQFVGELETLVATCVSPTIDNIDAAVPMYIHLMDFCRSLLYGRKMSFACYSVRLDKLPRLHVTLNRLFDFIRSRVDFYLTQLPLSPEGQAHLSFIYSYTESDRGFLLLGRSQDDVQFTLYAECFVDFLKLIKRIENFLNRTNAASGIQFNAFNKVIVVSDEHVGYVEERGGGHRPHINSYPLLGCDPAAASSVIVGPPVDCMRDDSGIVAVAWPMGPRATKQSTLFPPCYSQMFFIYLQRLQDVLTGQLVPDIEVLGRYSFEDGISGRVYFRHSHRIEFGRAAGYRVCSCGRSGEGCSTFDPAIIPSWKHVVIWGWRNEFIEKRKPGETGIAPENCVRVVSTIFPTICVDWSERAMRRVSDLSVTPAQNINMQDLFLSAMRSWLVSRDACELVWDRLLDDIAPNVFHDFVELSAQKNDFLARDKTKTFADFFKERKREIGVDKSLQGMKKILAIKQCDVLLAMLNDPFASSMSVQDFLRTFRAQILACARNKMMLGRISLIIGANRVISTYLRGRGTMLQWCSANDFFEFTDRESLLTGVKTHVSDWGDLCAMNLLDAVKDCALNPSGLIPNFGAISDGPVTVLRDHSRLILNSEVLGVPLSSGIAVIVPKDVFLRLL